MSTSTAIDPQKQDIVSGSEFFKELNPEERKAIATSGKLIRFSKNKTIFGPDHTGRSIYIVGEGILVLVLKNQDTVRYAKGDVFGEVAAFSQNNRLGTVRAISDVTLLSFELEDLIASQILPADTIVKILKKFMSRVLSYLYPLMELPTAKLINQGENENVEFKQSINTQHMGPILTTLVAFMNSNGGTVLAGVRDDKEIVGIEVTEEDKDKMLLKIIDNVKRLIGSIYSNLVLCSFEEINDKTILRIDCGHSGDPAFYGTKEKEKFYIRSGPSNVYLEPSKAIKYLRKRELEALLVDGGE